MILNNDPKLGVWGLGVRGYGLGFEFLRVSGLWGLGFEVYEPSLKDLGFRVLTWRFMVLTTQS